MITTATLDYDKGKEACEIAARNAGISCEYVVALDPVGQGGVKTANTAWKEALAADPAYLCYINDDVVASQDGWLKAMVDALELKPRFGIAGPSGPCGTEPQRSGRPGLPFGIVEVHQLSFFCTVIKRQVLNQLGLLDSEYIHWGCDSDYCLRARRADWKVIWTPHVYIDHDFTPVQTRPPKLQRWLDHDLRLFQERWNSEWMSY